MKNPFAGLVAYLRSAKIELEKVSWPTKEETTRYSALIISASVIAALFFGALDIGLSRGVQAIINTRTPDVTVDQLPPPTPEEILGSTVSSTPESITTSTAPIVPTAPGANTTTR